MGLDFENLYGRNTIGNTDYEQAREQFLEWRAEDRAAFNNRQEQDRKQLKQALAQAYNERMLYRAFIFLLLLVISG
jgi:hypothetical protein